MSLILQSSDFGQSDLGFFPACLQTNISCLQTNIFGDFCSRGIKSWPNVFKFPSMSILVVQSNRWQKQSKCPLYSLKQGDLLLKKVATNEDAVGYRQGVQFKLSFAGEYFPRQGLLPTFFFSGNLNVIIFCWNWRLAVDLSKSPQKQDQTARVGVTRPEVHWGGRD